MRSRPHRKPPEADAGVSATLSAHSQSLEVKREGAYADVLAEVKNIRSSQADLRRETTQLVAALRAPKARGNWGELQLKKCVEFAGMVQYASFDVERFVRGEDVSYRPDLVVKMPNGRTIIVDARLRSTPSSTPAMPRTRWFAPASWWPTQLACAST